MRAAHGFALAAILTVPSVAAVACFDAVNDCERNANLPCYAEGPGGSSSTGLPSGCDPLELEGGALDETCGVFVNPSASAGGSGTQSSPYATIAAALNDAPGKAIFVCATAGELSEAVEITAGVSLVGGVRCEDWKVASTRTVWTAPSGEVPLKLLATPSGLVQGFDIVAKPGSDFEPTTRQGDSSIAVIADGATATFADVSMTAGAGRDGEDGSTFPGQAPGAQDENTDFSGNPGTNCDDGSGGAPKPPPVTCPGRGEPSIGGRGGSYDEPPGEAGLPDYGPADPNGEPLMQCTGGQAAEAGHDGPDGNPGEKGSTAGAAFSAEGYRGDPGKAGGDGGAGQGGGGGAARPAKFNVCVNQNGYGGGGGGAGGCGGRGGTGGGAGGASIALLSLQSKLTLERVTLTAASGGNGGIGGDSQPGGEGGAGGPGVTAAACSGGPGGAGGNGGPGGGGSGGPSIGIAYSGDAPAGEPAIEVASSPSAGGVGGNGNMGENRGDDGIVAPIHSF